jgi:hypothetical protein
LRTDGGCHEGRIQWLQAVSPVRPNGLPDAHLFSVCTLGSRDEQYRGMCLSFAAYGLCGAENEFIDLDVEHDSNWVNMRRRLCGTALSVLRVAASVAGVERMMSIIVTRALGATCILDRR